MGATRKCFSNVSHTPALSQTKKDQTEAPLIDCEPDIHSQAVIAKFLVFLVWLTKTVGINPTASSRWGGGWHILLSKQMQENMSGCTVNADNLLNFTFNSQP